MLLPPPTSTLFPYTTLFRSLQPKTKVCGVALCADIPDAVGDVRADRGDRGGDVDEFQNQQQHQLRIYTVAVPTVVRLPLSSSPHTSSSTSPPSPIVTRPGRRYGFPGISTPR